MKNKLRRFNALILAMAMSLSLLSANVWAADELDPLVDEGATVQSSEGVGSEEELDEEAEQVEDTSADEEVEPEGSLVEEPADSEPKLVVQESTSGRCGKNLSWTLDTDGVLNIKGTGDMQNWGLTESSSDGSWTILDSPWYNNTNVRKIVIDIGVTSIGDVAFSGCSNLTSVSIPKGISYIGASAFQSCRNLTELSIPESVTSIGDYAFEGCNNITNLTLPNSITIIGYQAFSSCGLTDIEVPSGVEKIDSAFSWCSNLVNVSIPNSVNSIEYGSFLKCSNLTSATIPSLVTSIQGETFWGCSSLAKIYIPVGVKNIEASAFYGCTSLSDVYFGGSESDWNRIIIEVDNDCLTDATIHFNSSTPNEGDNEPYSTNEISLDKPPHYPEDGQGYWVIFKEGYRDNRVELSTCNLKNDTQGSARIVWNKNLTIQGSTIEGNCNQYYYNSDGNWEKIGTYGLLTDWATEVIASNLDIYDKSGNLILRSTAYDGERNQSPEISSGVFTFNKYDSLNSSVYLNNWPYRLADNADTSFTRKLNDLIDRKVLVETQDNKVMNIFMLEEHIGKIQDYSVYEKNGTSFASSISISGKRYLTISEEVYNWSNYDDFPCGAMIAFYVVDGKIVQLERLNYRTGRLDTRVLSGDTITIDGENLVLSQSFEKQFTNKLADWEGKRIGYYVGTSKDPTKGQNVVYQLVGLVDDKASIKLYCSIPDMQLHVGESMDMVASLLINDDTANSWSRPAFVVGNKAVISMSDYTSTSLGYEFEIRGVKEGTSSLTITDSESGAHLTVNITVVPASEKAKNYSYKLDAVPSFYPNAIGDRHTLTNFYNFNGMYVNNYKTENVENGTQVEFDVYNNNYMTGAVDVFDANGSWIQSEAIKKYTDISSIYETGKAAYYLIKDGIHGDVLSYTANSFSVKTHIKVVVPEGGYFSISNNFAVSPGVYLYNCIDYLTYSIEAVTDVLIGGVKDVSLYDSFQRALDDSAVKNSMTKAQIRDLFVKKMNSKLTKAIGTTTTINIGNSMGVVTNDFTDVLKSLGISWKEVFKTSAGIGESVFEKLSGPPGVVLKGLFTVNKVTSRAYQTNSLAHSLNRAYITVHSKVSAKNSATVSGVTVSYDQGVVDDESVLQVFRIGAPADTWFIQGEYTYPEQYTLYNISFVKNEENVQPNGKVTVRIPIPEGMSSDKCTVFRQEKDSSWTQLEARVDGNLLVFETDHFSLYLLKETEKTDNDTPGTDSTPQPHPEIQPQPQPEQETQPTPLHEPEPTLQPEPVEKVVNTITGKNLIFRTYNKKKNQSFNLGAKTKGGAKLSYKSSNKKVTVKNGKVTVKKGFMGKVTITVSASETAKYKKAQKKITLMVGPSASKLSSVKWDKKKKVVNVSWKKNTTGKGYEIQVALKKDFKKVAKKVKIKKNSTVKTTIKGLKKGTYYVRIRTINGKTYSDWSKAKTVKITK